MPFLDTLVNAGVQYGLPALLGLIGGRSRAAQQGVPYNPLGTLLGYPELREPFMGEGAQQYTDMLKSMGPFASQLFGGSPDAFSPMYQQAMQRFESEIAPQIAGSYGRYGGTRYAGAMPQSLAQAGRMMGTDLAAQQMQAQMGLLQTLLGGMPGMRQTGQLQQERPGMLANMLQPSAPGKLSPLQEIAMSGLNAARGYFGGEQVPATSGVPSQAQLKMMQQFAPAPAPTPQQLFGPSATVVRRQH